MTERVVPRQGLTPGEIHALSDEALIAALPAQKKQEVFKLTKGFFDFSPPKRREDEGYGQFKERSREAALANDRELARSLRENFEGALYESQQEKRLVDALSASITPETVREQEAKDVARAERESQRELDGDIGVQLQDYGAFAEWEEK